MPNENKQHSCCFFGHRKIDESPELTEKLILTIENLINERKVTDFYFGSKSEFNSLCLEMVTRLKEKYPHIRRIYVRSDYPDISDSYENYLLENYEDTYFLEKMRNAGKASYVERNQEMINKSAFCIFYYNENYSPPKRKNSKQNLTDYQPKSGTKVAYNYAIKKKCEIINIFTESNNNV